MEIFVLQTFLSKLKVKRFHVFYSASFKQKIEIWMEQSSEEFDNGSFDRRLYIENNP